jgi:hypothetical protein
MTGPATRRILTTALLAGTLTLTAATLTTPTAAADPTATAWAKLRDCESGDNYHIVSVNGHYGAYKFDLPTWRSVGGHGKPNLATPTEQDYRALYLYRMRGWQPWTCAHTIGLHPDHDARSKRIPTRAEAAYIGHHPTPVTTGHTHTPAAPPWPGVVYAYGDCARPLRTFQLHMNTYGYHFTGTGCYHTKTRTAVLALQHANHITASGRLGPKTWKAAWHGTAP